MDRILEQRCMYTGQLNILRWLTSGLLENTSSSVLFSSTLCGVRLCTYTAVRAAYTHRCIGRSWSWSIALAASMIILLSLSATPFYCGLYGVDNSLLIPKSLHNSLNSFDVNSLPLSDRKVLIFFQCGSWSRLWIPWTCWILHLFSSWSKPMSS